MNRKHYPKAPELFTSDDGEFGFARLELLVGTAHYFDSAILRLGLKTDFRSGCSTIAMHRCRKHHFYPETFRTTSALVKALLQVDLLEDLTLESGLACYIA